MSEHAVGIDAVSVWPGKLRLDLAETFAPARDEAPAKYTDGLGLRASSLPDVHEDVVTMAANASKRLLEREGLSLDDIGRIDVATESAFDNAKPVSTYVAGCLEQVLDGDVRHANAGERKFACIAGTQAVDDACNWIRAGRNRGRAALVVATDTALYARGDPGEATQGAGAVAMLVDEDPSVVALSREQGFGTADETDFLKPERQFPSVDGERSVRVYLDRMRGALVDYESVAGATAPDEVAYAPFHTPFPGMVRKAAPLAYRYLSRGTPVEDELAGAIGRQPRRDEFDDAAAYETAMRDYADALAGTDRYRDWYDAVVEPTLDVAREVGNWYTGSVHLARVAALRDAAREGRDLTDGRLLVGSYGSGAQAEVHAETVREGWRDAVDALRIDDDLAGRYELDFDEYERVHDAHNRSVDVDVGPFTTPADEFVRDGRGPMDERTYRYVA